MKYKTITTKPDTSKIKTPVIVVYNIKVRGPHPLYGVIIDTHHKYVLHIFCPTVKIPLTYKKVFKTGRQALDIAKKILVTIPKAEIVKMVWVQ